MQEVKAEYIISKDDVTDEEVHVRMIPPAPEGKDLGGITHEEREKIAKNETFEVEVTQTASGITSTKTYSEIMEAYSAGRDVIARYNSELYSGTELVMQKTGNSVNRIEFVGTMELSNKLIFLHLECSNQDVWKLISKQYLEASNYYLVVEDGAGSHNSIYRGKNLGTAITDEQFANIANGTFKDLFVGDYWTINDVKYMIADFDYMYNIGDTALTKHHIVVVPERNMYNHVMNDTNTTKGGYVASKMYKEGLNDALTSFKDAFGESHVLTYKNLLTTDTTNGIPSNFSWNSRQIDLMSESMVYGQGVWRKSGYDVGCQKSQLSLFKHRHDMILSARDWYWLRDVYTENNYVRVNAMGFAIYDGASYSGGVRPFALIG